MDNKIPYINPDQDANINVMLLILVIFFLGKSARGIPLLNNDRLLIFIYLIKNPVVLDNVLEQVGRREIVLTNVELFSINSISINLDPLFDRNWLKSLLMRLSSLGYLDVTYRKADGFMYLLTSSGNEIAERINGSYFNRVKIYLKNLEMIRSESTVNINRLINNIFRH
ncbi:ABC-three component system middle component 4 [Janthinobacterium sp.]|uniref:ABC-three component system middle component 4 n=1 Tax=Janthinobacterium sp. TaxID=1871054 RepID=UPI00293D3D6D|nr:ABC-three component system middle component 4 [Janthinobacterium sp.]